MISTSTQKSNTIKIEKDKKIYNLDISCNENEIILKCRIDKPLTYYERNYSKTELEEICKIIKDIDIKDIYASLLDSLEKKQFVFDIKEDSIMIKLNKINIFEYKELILPQKEIGDSEKIENLYQIQENLMSEINTLKIDNENLKKEIKSIKEENEKLKNDKKKEIKEEYEIIDVELNGSNYGIEYNPFRVYKLKNGFVKLSGLIRCALGENICQLPENVRPKGILVFNCMAYDKSIRVDVSADGYVHPYGKGISWLSLDNIFYLSGN